MANKNAGRLGNLNFRQATNSFCPVQYLEHTNTKTLFIQNSDLTECPVFYLEMVFVRSEEGMLGTGQGKGSESQAEPCTMAWGSLSLGQGQSPWPLNPYNVHPGLRPLAITVT